MLIPVINNSCRFTKRYECRQVLLDTAFRKIGICPFDQRTVLPTATRVYHTIALDILSHRVPPLNHLPLSLDIPCFRFHLIRTNLSRCGVILAISQIPSMPFCV